jgi:hypothetical protein
MIPPIGTAVMQGILLPKNYWRNYSGKNPKSCSGSASGCLRNEAIFIKVMAARKSKTDPFSSGHPKGIEETEDHIERLKKLLQDLAAERP